jgi:hypothetical protein
MTNIVRTEPTVPEMVAEAVKQLAETKGTKFVIAVATPEGDGCDLIPCNVTPPEALWLLEQARMALLDGYCSPDPDA